MVSTAINKKQLSASFNYGSGNIIGLIMRLVCEVWANVFLHVDIAECQIEPLSVL